MAYPTKCTPETVAAILEGLALPLSLEAACTRAGLHHDTYYEWRDRAAKSSEPFLSAVIQIERARVEQQIPLVRGVIEIAQHGTKDDATRLNAHKFLLERMHAREWNPPTKLEHSGPDGGAIELSTTADDELLAKLARLAPRPGDGDDDADDGGT